MRTLPCLFIPACACALLLASCGESGNPKSEPVAAPASGSPPANPSHYRVVRPRTDSERLRDITVIVRDIAQIPRLRQDQPGARINLLISAGDGSGRLFVNDMDGKIYVIKDDKVLPVPLLDMVVARNGAFTSKLLYEQGLNGLAFHPDFAKRGTRGHGKLYTSSTELPDSGKPDFPAPDSNGPVAHHDVLAEWTINADDPDRVDPTSRRELLRIAHPLPDHVMGQLGFAPYARPSDADYGMLYIGVGDGGNTVGHFKQVDAMRNAQNRRSPLGKILRINPLASGSQKYSVPPDNPFVNDASSLKEIWALGLRNPQRFSWDSGGKHMMLIADIGQAHVEEVNIGRAGANYGWGEREGTFVVDHADEHHWVELPFGDLRFGYTYPAIQYGHDVGKAITGGYVYRGKTIPRLHGMYLFGDIVNGRLFFAEAATLTNGRPGPYGEIKLRYLGRDRTLLQILNNDWRADLRFGMDDRGDVYLLTKRDGMIRKLAEDTVNPGTAHHPLPAFSTATFPHGAWSGREQWCLNFLHAKRLR